MCALESCFNQTYKNIEIVVIDDGSTDNTHELLVPYIDTNKIKYIYQPNKGVSAARNSGLKNAIGEFVQFLDSDDLLEPTKIEKQVDFLNLNKNYFGVYSRWKIFNGEDINSLVKIKIAVRVGYIQKYLLFGNIMPTNSLLLRRGEELFDESLIIGEDWDYWYRVFAGRQIGFMDESLCYIRFHKNNSSINLKNNVLNDIKVLNKIASNYNIQDNKRLLSKIEFEKFKRLLSIKDKECIRNLKKSFWLYPLIIGDFIYFSAKCVYYKSKKILKKL
jgi:glycosyltransferase involved in cell wall biosynthesis